MSDTAHINEKRLPLSGNQMSGDWYPAILPIQIRKDLVVRIQGIPFDFTKNEATKVADVIIAMGR